MTADPPIHGLHSDDASGVDDVPGPKSTRFLEKRQRIDSSAVSYPEDIPITFDSRKDVTVRDVDGDTFTDTSAGVGVSNIEHSNSYVLEAAHEQTDKFVHTVDFPVEARLDLIEKLDEIASTGLCGNNRVVFDNPMGGDAIGAFIKLAKYNAEGTGLATFHDAYYGATSGTMSLIDNKKFRGDCSPPLPGVVHASCPSTIEMDKGPQEAIDHYLEEVETIFGDPYGDLASPAGIFVEPIQGEGGAIILPKEFLKGLRDVADDNDVPLVFDEIQSGLDHSGKWWASEWYGVTPDVMTSAKALDGAGFPLSATTYHEDPDTWGSGDRVSMYHGHVIGMRVGARVIGYIQEYDLLAHTHDLDQCIRGRLPEVTEDNLRIADVHGKSLFIGAEFVDVGGNSGGETVDALQQCCSEHDVLVWKVGRYDNILQLLPSFVLIHDFAETAPNVITDGTEAIAAGTQRI